VRSRLERAIHGCQRALHISDFMKDFGHERQGAHLQYGRAGALRHHLAALHRGQRLAEVSGVELELRGAEQRRRGPERLTRLLGEPAQLREVTAALLPAALVT
jgi:hypothetical protein